MAKTFLEGLRICDVTTFWSGPYCTAYLGGLGAEVIKVESVQRPDGFRFGTDVFDGWQEAYAQWNCSNVNKYDVTLNLNDPRGLELFKELVKISDIVIENFSARVMPSFNLDYEHLRELKPDLIMMSMPIYGMYGPWRDQVGYGLSLEHASGLTYLTGYEGGDPANIGGFSDPVAGMVAAFALLAAIQYKRRTGKGQFIDMSQAEALTCFLGQPVIDHALNGRVWGRMGNHDPMMAPHNVYRCKGDDKWLSISVQNDDQFKVLCQLIGQPDLAADQRFSTILGRLKNQKELDAIVARWSIEQDDYEATYLLLNAGIPAGAAPIPDTLHNDPQLKDRRYFVEIDRKVVGKQLYPIWPIRFSNMQVAMKAPPLLGEHNEYVLGKLLGVSHAEMEELAERHVIGTVPIGIKPGMGVRPP